jgi:hypothetical protein
MKILSSALLLLACALPLWADECLVNGDFADGITHWRGSGRAPSDFAADNPLAAPDPLTSKGLIVPLKHGSWTMVAQDFTSKTNHGYFSITYRLSPGLTFSEKPEDYVNIPDHLGWGWRSFNTPPKKFLVFISELNTVKGTYNMIEPKLGTNDPQTARLAFPNLVPAESKSLTLAFPPGDGNLVILNVSILDELK